MTIKLLFILKLITEIKDSNTQTRFRSFMKRGIELFICKLMYIFYMH